MKASQSQQYTLHWTDFNACVASAFQELRDEQDFVDVTLACDGQSFGAHKVVLSACSPYLRQLLKMNPCKHPIVILQDINGTDMEALLDYMYKGEVRVMQEQLPTFIRSAESLQLRGLANDKDATESFPFQTECEPPHKERPSHSKSHKRVTEGHNMRPPKRRKTHSRKQPLLIPGHHDPLHGASSDLSMAGLKASMESLRAVNKTEDGSAPTADVQSLELMCEDAMKANNVEGCLADGTADTTPVAIYLGGKRRNASDRPTNCPLCGSTIRQARNLRRHLELMHFNSGKTSIRIRGKGKAKNQPPPEPSATPATTANSSPEQNAALFSPYTKQMQEIQLNPYSVMISNQMAAQAYFSHIQPPAFPNDGTRRPPDVMQDNMVVAAAATMGPPVPCPECGLVLNHPRVIEHLQSSHPQSVFLHRTCLDCRQIFDTTEQLQEHREQIHREPFHREQVHHRGAGGDQQIATASRDGRHGDRSAGLDPERACNPTDRLTAALPMT